MISPEVKTSKKTRIAILCIAVLMVASTIVLYISMVVSNQNSRKDMAAEQALQEELNVLLQEHEAKVTARAAVEVDPVVKELSDRYYAEFSAYKVEAKAFNAAAVTELVTEDLKEGDGAVIEDNASYSAYYIGWLPDGTIFQSSILDGSLSAPISTDSYIEGWNEGVKGMKIGGIRMLTIPAAQAYDAYPPEGSNIPANSPLKFILLTVPKIVSREDIAAEIPYSKGTYDACLKAYESYDEQYGEGMTEYYCEAYSNEEK